MDELWVSVDRVEWVCTGPVPMSPGRGFLVRDGRLLLPGGGPICMYALQSVIPLLPAKERTIAEDKKADWLWRVDEIQCPDPKGRVVWRIEKRPLGSTQISFSAAPEPIDGDLRIVVQRVLGTCTSGMAPGRELLVRGSSMYLSEPFCLYALQAVLPLLPAVQRSLAPDDWMAKDNVIVCPDPTGNVLLRVDRL
jgi:uncharacterized repeat protein (TIGR04076 family)